MSTLENYLHKIMAAEERSWPRLKCKYFTDCHDSRGNQWACKIVDISGHGLGIVSSAVLHQGEIISLTEPRTKARVVWATKDRAGLRVCN